MDVHALTSPALMFSAVDLGQSGRRWGHRGGPGKLKPTPQRTFSVSTARDHADAFTVPASYSPARHVCVCLDLRGGETVVVYVCLFGGQTAVVCLQHVLIVDWRMQCSLFAWCVLMGCQSPSSQHQLCSRCICVREREYEPFSESARGAFSDGFLVA